MLSKYETVDPESQARWNKGLATVRKELEKAIPGYIKKRRTINAKVAERSKMIVLGY